MAISPLTNAVSGFNNAAKRISDAAVAVVDGDIAPAAPVTYPVKLTTNVVDVKNLAPRDDDNSGDDTAQALVNAAIATYDAKANLKVVSEEKQRAGDVLNIVG